MMNRQVSKKNLWSELAAGSNPGSSIPGGSSRLGQADWRGTQRGTAADDEKQMGKLLQQKEVDI